jgi:hypothetical protein
MFVQKFTFLRREIESDLDLTQEVLTALFRVFFEEFGKSRQGFFQFVSRALGWDSHVAGSVEVNVDSVLSARF